MESKTFKFQRQRTNKKNWEDAACENCNEDMWILGEVRYVWVLVKPVLNIWIQLCDKCFKLI